MINIQMHFVGYFYIMDLINERKWKILKFNLQLSDCKLLKDPIPRDYLVRQIR